MRGLGLLKHWSRDHQSTGWRTKETDARVYQKGKRIERQGRLGVDDNSIYTKNGGGCVGVALFNFYLTHVYSQRTFSVTLVYFSLTPFSIYQSIFIYYSVYIYLFTHRHTFPGFTPRTLVRSRAHTHSIESAQCSFEGPKNVGERQVTQICVSSGFSMSLQSK